MAESADGNDNAFRQPRHTTVSSCKGPEAAARSDNTNSIGSKSRVATKYRPTVFDVSTLMKTKNELAMAQCLLLQLNCTKMKKRLSLQLHTLIVEFLDMIKLDLPRKYTAYIYRGNRDTLKKNVKITCICHSHVQCRSIDVTVNHRKSVLTFFHCNCSIN